MKIKKLVPELLVEDMGKTLKFYEDILGFKTDVLFPEDKPVFAQISCDGVEIMLFLRADFEKEITQLKNIKMQGSFALYFEIDDGHRFYEQIKDKVKIIQALHQTDYGTLEFSLEDCNDYFLMFASQVKRKITG